MEPFLALILLGLALAGSTGLWITFLNRSHGLGAWRPLIHCCSALSLLGVTVGPLLILVAALAYSPDCLAALPSALVDPLRIAAGSRWEPLAELYAGVCLLIAVGPVTWWLTSTWRARAPRHLQSDNTTRLDVVRQLADKNLTHGVGRLAAVFPGNQVFQLEVSEKAPALPQLPPRLAGLTIAHLSDLHMSGRVTIDYFHEVVERTNALAPDLIAITGDIVDAAKCVDWIPATLGRLNAPLGVYGVLGNHDVCVDLAQLRDILQTAGVTNLGGRSQRLDVAGETVLLAGNELPWITAADASLHDRAAADASYSLRVLLSHSPDQIGWARRRRFDLMLAGHTHGGQICLPLVGAILAPSVFGTRYASGLFYEAPTLMHVSRGVSGLTPVRYNCRPEITLLRLVRAEVEPAANDAALAGEEALTSGS